MPPDFVELVKLARNGDAVAWETMVAGLQGLVWWAIADFGLSLEDRQDVFAATFHRLVERLDTIREPTKLPGWMATTARNEALTTLRARSRVEVRDELGEGAADPELPERSLLDQELRTALHAALQKVPPRCQQLLRLLTADPPLSYEEIGELLAMSHGSIGPTRQRCLERLRQTPELRAFLAGDQ